MSAYSLPLLLEPLAMTLTAVLSYIIIHELSHAVAAILLGYRVRIGIRSDGILPSPAIFVAPPVSRQRDKLIILYSPYMVTLAIIVIAATTPMPWLSVLGAVALVGFPNIVLEEHTSYARMVVSLIASLLTAYLVLTSIG